MITFDFFLAKWINPWVISFFKCDQICMKDVECTETNEKSIFQFFSFGDIVVFILKIGQFLINLSTELTIAQKTKI